ncbi:MAG: TOMM precursor leader peptide-binding protein [Bradyrhizobium sp.]|nr:TOMM precursor leader peptide-binding protein [Bradyrhizobium sp.]
MKTKRKTRAPRQAAKKPVNKSVKKAAKEIVQFAPNFTAYVLPPATICLYSEHRKFFLHGELYVAIAEAIGKHGKDTQALIHELSRKYPVDQIQEGLKRLYDRRYVTIASPVTTGPVAGFWASLGLPPQAAEEALANCRVRVEAIDVQGAKELTRALSDLGVRVVARSADLTVTLVNDYLDRRLAELNRKHVDDKTPWLLAQPSGAFPLVGPVFKPGESACWTCLSDRMLRNREIKGFLDRAEGRIIAESPLVRNPFGQGAIQFAAVEIAKAIASGFRTDLREHIASFDLMGATITKHFVARRPQCPVCGDKKLQNPKRAPEPVTINPGTRLIMTSGGYRSVSSRTTVSRYRKHVSPLTGVVTRLEKMEGDLPLNTNFFAHHNFSAPAVDVDQLRSGLNGGSSGKGSTAEQAEASALMEAIERYSGIFQGDEIRMKRRFTDFAKGEAYLANDVQHFSEAQFASRNEPQPDGSHPVPDPIDPDAEIEWTPVWSLRDQRFKYFPTGLLYFFYEDFHTDSNGCAAGNSREEAIVQGFLELVERDAYAIWWYNRLRRSEVDLGEFDDAYIRDIKSQFADHGRKIWVLDITSDLGVPTYVAIMHWINDGKENIEFGSGSHFDRRIALLRSLTELSQFLSIGEGGLRGDRSTLDGVTPLRLENYPFLQPAADSVAAPPLGIDVPLDSVKEQVEACVEVARRAGYDFLVLDQTRPDVGVPVVRVIVPGLRHFYKRFGPGRLYDVPVTMGLLDRPRREDELTPFLPHT